MYALNLSQDNRILSVTYEQYAAPGQPIVSTLPDDDITNYLYINGNYIYSPLPQPPEPAREPTSEELLDIILGVEE